MGRNGTRSGLLLFLILLLCFAAIVFIGTEVFQVEKFTVIGSSTLDKNVIMNLSGVSYGDNIFKVSKRQVKNRIEDHVPYPVVQSVSFKLPDEVVIIVDERKPAAIIPYLSSYIVIDKDGFIMDIIKQSQGPSIPVIEGVHITRLTKGTLLLESSLKSESYRHKILIRLLEAITEWETSDIIQTIFLDDPDNISLLTQDEIQVIMGQAVDLDRKLGWFQSDAYSELLLRGEEGVLDVSVPGKAVFHPTPPVQEEELAENEQQKEDEIEE